MSAAEEGCSGCPLESVKSASGILGATSSKGKSKVSSSSWGLPLLILIISGKVNESLYPFLMAESNTSRFFISYSRNNLSGVSLCIVCSGIIFPCCFITHCNISLPSFFAGPRQRPKTCEGYGNFPVVSRKYTHSYHPNWHILEMFPSSPNVA